MSFEFEQGWMENKEMANYGKKDGIGRGMGRQGGGRRNINKGGCAEGGPGYGRGGGKGGGKNRLG
jgi:hypothetical protein